jgi:hypothetical protein
MPLRTLLIAVGVTLLTTFQGFAGSDEAKLMSLFPVPLKGSRLTVRINYGGSGVARIEIRNLIGKKIQEQPIADGSGEAIFEGIDNNPNGVYMVVAKNGNGKVLEISKFILNN